MFDTISVPRSNNSSYYGIPTQKDCAVQYSNISKNSYGVAIGFLENTNKVVVLSGELQKPLYGVWKVQLKDPRDMVTYTVTIAIKDNELMEVADAKGVIWRSESIMPSKLHTDCLELAGCLESVLAAQAKERIEGQGVAWG